MSFRLVFSKILVSLFFVHILNFKVIADDHPLIPTLLECVTAIGIFSQAQNQLPLNLARANIAVLLQIIEADKRLAGAQKEEMTQFLTGLESNPTAYIEMWVGARDVKSRLHQWAELVDASELLVENHTVDLADAVLPVEWTKSKRSKWSKFYSWLIEPKEIKPGPRKPRESGVSSVPRDLLVDASFGIDSDAPPSFFFWTTPFTKSTREFFEGQLNVPKKWMEKLEDRSHLIFFSTTAHGDPVLFFASGSSNF